MTSQEDREEALYHESARDLARQIVDLETTVEGLGQQNTDLEGKIVALEELVRQHKLRYANAIHMIRGRQKALNEQRSAYQRLALHYTKVSDAIREANKSVRELKNVNTVDLDHAIDVVANAIDAALLTE